MKKLFDPGPVFTGPQAKLALESWKGNLNLGIDSLLARHCYGDFGDNPILECKNTWGSTNGGEVYSLYIWAGIEIDIWSFPANSKGERETWIFQNPSPDTKQVEQEYLKWQQERT